MSKMTFRFYEEGDEAGIVEVMNSAFSSFRNWGLDTNKWLSYEDDDYAFKKKNALVAEYNGRIVGHVQLIMRKLKIGESTYVENCGIANVSTRPEFRGRGIATELMKMALKFCRDRKIPLSALFTGYPGTPHRIYRRVGYANTLYSYVFAAEIDEILEGVDEIPSSNVKMLEIEPSDVDQIAKVYEEAHRDYIGTSLRPREYWLKKVLGGKVYFQTFFYERPEAFIRLKAVKDGEIVGYIIAAIPKKAKYKVGRDDTGVILEIVSTDYRVIGSLLIEALNRFRNEGLKSIIANVPITGEYFEVFRDFEVFKERGIFMEAVPCIKELFNVMSNELSNRLERYGIKGRFKVLIKTPRGEAPLVFNDFSVRCVRSVDNVDFIVSVSWNEFTKMIYGIEGFLEILADGKASVCGKDGCKKIIRALSAAFPSLKFHIWAIDHW